MRERLIWFHNPDCEYCTEIEDQVKEFAHKRGAGFVPVLSGIYDEETGEPRVPAILFMHPKTENHIFLGRFCLEALRYTLENG